MTGVKVFKMLGLGAKVEPLWPSINERRQKGYQRYDWGCRMCMKEDGEGDELCFEEKPARERGVGRRGWYVPRRVGVARD